MPDEPDDFEIERIGDTIVFRFRRTSILDEQSTGWFGENVFRAADATPQPRIVVDFRNVIFISSAGLGKLLTLHRKVQAAGGWLKVVNLSPDVADVLPAGAVGVSSMPSPTKCACTFGSLRICSRCSFSFCRIGCGVFAGAAKPYHSFIS